MEVNTLPSRPIAPQVAAMRQAAAQASALLKTLSNPDRLLLLCELSQGERCVRDLEHSLDIHQPTLSQQLGVLRQENLVLTRRDGKQIYYQIASEPALAILTTLYGLYCPPQGDSTP